MGENTKNYKLFCWTLAVDGEKETCYNVCDSRMLYSAADPFLKNRRKF